jgi:hypothetical protein
MDLIKIMEVIIVKNIKYFLLALLLASVLSLSDSYPALATWNSVNGHVLYINVYPGGLVLFKMDTQPSTGCTNNGYFGFSASSITDPQSRNQLLAVLMFAKSTNTMIQVGYDSGAYCDNQSGYPTPYGIFSI